MAFEPVPFSGSFSMTRRIQLEMTCACCKTAFESTGLTSTNTVGRKTDFHPITSGCSPLPFLIHTCPTCGYSGFRSDFNDDVQLSQSTTNLIQKHLRPMLGASPLFTGRKYEFKARIDECQGQPAHVVAHMYLMAAWCCDDDNMMEEEALYRRRAIKHFEDAIRDGTLPQPDAAAVTYLIGELYRRVGDNGAAALWFNRVAEAVGEQADKRWLITRAQKQKTDPDEILQ